jgi:hypothetical protein
VKVSLHKYGAFVGICFYISKGRLMLQQIVFIPYYEYFICVQNLTKLEGTLPSLNISSA